MAKKSKQPAPVPIVHMKLDYDMAKAEHDTEAMRRIKDINKYLRDQRFVSREPGSEGQPVDATKLTIAKKSSTPLMTLLTGKNPSIGGEEFMAAQDIELAFMSISGAVMFKPLTLERVDKSNADRALPLATAKAIERYQAWANHWSARKKRGDRTLEIVIAAIVDMRPFSVIEEDIGIRHGMAKQVTIRGLRDYAARAGWAGRRTQEWLSEAVKSFPGRDPNRLIQSELKRALERMQVPSPDLREIA